MKEILLTQGKVALVDDEDFEKLNRYKWYAMQTKQNWYSVRNIRINNKQTLVCMHREIINAPINKQVDHINGNGLDNQKKNLRLCTHQQTQHNKRNPNKNNKLGIKGVRWCERDKKFQAQIEINGKEIRLGYFKNVSDADSAYRKAEKKYFGEFARI